METPLSAPPRALTMRTDQQARPGSGKPGSGDGESLAEIPFRAKTSKRVWAQDANWSAPPAIPAASIRAAAPPDCAASARRRAAVKS